MLVEVVFDYRERVDVEAVVPGTAEVHSLFDYETLLFVEFTPVEGIFPDLKFVSTPRSKGPPFAMPVFLHSVLRD